MVFPRTSSDRSRGGFTLVEVMIAMALLAITLSAIAANLFSLNGAHTSNREEAKVREISQLLGERLMGASWDTLGTSVSGQIGLNGWSWHRRATSNPNVPNSPIYECLQENPSPTASETDPDSRDLLKLGLISGPTGIRGLRVYLEYYQMTILNEIRLLTTQATPLSATAAWQREVGEPRTSPVMTMNPLTDITIQESTATINLAQIDPAVVMRILVRWEPQSGGVRWHELVLARRK